MVSGLSSIVGISQARDQEWGFALVFGIGFAEIAQEFAFFEIRADDKVQRDADVEHQRINAHGWTQTKEQDAEKI